MRTIIAGSRTVSENDVIGAIQSCPWSGFISTVVSGTAKGADKFGEKWANEHKIKINRFPAEWEKYGKRAGPMRNKVMSENADALIAVWDGKSRGTRSMIDMAAKQGLRIFVFKTIDKTNEEYEPTGQFAAVWEYAEERAAIYEYCAGIPRKQAEQKAGLSALHQARFCPTQDAEKQTSKSQDGNCETDHLEKQLCITI